MNAFINTYLPTGILIATVVICFYINIIDTGRRRDSTNPYDHVSDRKLEVCLIIGIILGALACYAGIPLSVLWGMAIGSAVGLAIGLLRRKRGR